MIRLSRRIGAASAAFSLLFAAPSLASAASGEWTSSPRLFEVRTLAGQPEQGNADGSLKTATFYHPYSTVALPDGKLLVADSANHLLRVVTADKVTTYSGLYLGENESSQPLGAYRDDVLAKAAFDRPSGLSVDPQGNVYVADSANHAIRKISPDGKVSTLAGNGLLGSSDGTGGQAAFYNPSDVAVDSQGNVYVADTLNHTIRKIATDGKVTTVTAPSTRIIEYVAGAVEEAGDYQDGPLASAKFNEPSGLVIDAQDNLYVSDRGNQRIRYINFTSGQVSTVAGGGGYADSNAYFVSGGYVDGPATQARFNAPEGLSLTDDGALVIADSLNHAIRLLKNGKVSTLAGVPGEPGQSGGVPSAAQFNHPTDVTVLKDGRLVIADEYGNKLRVLQPYAKPASLPSQQGASVLYNGSLVPSDVPAQLKGNAVLLPLRAVGQALGFKVGYDKTTGKALLTRGDTVYAISADDRSVTKTVAGKSTRLELNAMTTVIDGRLFIPVRFFADESGLDIQWDSTARAVVIRSKTF